MKQILLILYITFLHFSTQAQTVIKMKREGGVSIIPCKVNSVPMSFVFDTGASNVTISLTEANFMFKNGYLNKNDITGVSNYSDANGDITEGININLREIEIQGLKLYNVEASIVKNMDAPLLLGQSAISKLGKIQLDLNSNTLTITNDKLSYDFLKTNKKHNNITKSQLIGKPIKIENIEIAQHGFSYKMNLDDAKNACEELGDGWRLPTESELIKMYNYKKKIGNFFYDWYWSSTDQNENLPKPHLSYFITKHFGLGGQSSDSKDYTAYVRPVRSID